MCMFARVQQSVMDVHFQLLLDGAQESSPAFCVGPLDLALGPQIISCCIMDPGLPCPQYPEPQDLILKG